MSTRLRTRTDPTVTQPGGAYTYLNISSDGNYTATGGGGGGTSGSVVTSLGSSFISDEVTPGSVRTTKNVGHLKYKHNVYPIDAYAGYVAGVAGYSFTGPNVFQHVWGSPSPMYVGQDVHEILSWSFPKSPLAMMRQAKREFDNINAANNLLNVVESPQLASSANDIVDLLTRQRRIKGSSVKAGASLLDIAHALPSLYLGYSFGISPLASDIQKSYKAARSLQNDLSKRVKNDKSTIVSTVKSKGSLILNPSWTSANYAWPSPTSGWWHPKISSGSALRVVGVKGKHRENYTSDGFKKLDYMLSRFVSSGPATYVWERIPYSFVVDWFVDLSSVIGALDEALTGSSRKYTDGWISEKIVADVDVSFNDTRPTHWSDQMGGTTVAEDNISVYLRDYMDPNSISIGPSGNFGKKQASLAAALLYQLVAKFVRG